MATTVLAATGVINALTLELTGTTGMDDVIFKLVSAGTITTSDAEYFRKHTDGYKVKLHTTFSSDKSSSTNETYMNCIYPATASATLVTSTTPASKSGYCVTAASNGSSNSNLRLNWIPIGIMTGSTNPTTAQATYGYTYTPNTYDGTTSSTGNTGLHGLSNQKG